MGERTGIGKEIGVDEVQAQGCVIWRSFALAVIASSETVGKDCSMLRRRLALQEFFQAFFIGSQRKTPPGWGGIQKFSNGSGFGYIMDGRGRKALGFEFSNRIKEEEQTADFDDNFLVDYKNKSDCLQQQSTDGHQCQKSC